MVRLTPGATDALLVFLQQPGVAELINQAEADLQEQSWRDERESRR